MIIKDDRVKREKRCLKDIQVGECFRSATDNDLSHVYMRLGSEPDCKRIFEECGEEELPENLIMCARLDHGYSAIFREDQPVYPVDIIIHTA